jgi:hypothetical protein
MGGLTDCINISNSRSEAAGGSKRAASVSPGQKSTRPESLQDAPSKKIPKLGGTNVQYLPQKTDGTLDVGFTSSSISGWLPCQAEDSSYEWHTRREQDS